MLFLAALAPLAPLAAAGDGDLERALALSSAGELRVALALLEKDTDESLPAHQPGRKLSVSDIDTRLLRVDVLRRLGSVARAEKELSALQAVLDTAPPVAPAQLSQAYRQRALLYYREGEAANAQAAIALALATQAGLSPAQRSQLLNDQALIHQRMGDYRLAIDGFDAAADLVTDNSIRALYLINAARARLEDGRVEDALVTANQADELLDEGASGTVIRARIALASLYRMAVNEFDAVAQYRLAALQQLQRAGQVHGLASRTRSLLDGYSAELYADDRQYEGAIQYAQRALQYAKQVQADSLAYRWEWVLARSYGALGNNPMSLAAYARAVTSLRTMRSNLETLDPDTFTRIIQPLYYEYADALLSQSSTVASAEAQQKLLRDARLALEELKLAEVQDYFDEQCVGDESVVLDQLAGNAAVLYPVMLESRIELLLTSGSGIEQITVPVERSRVVAQIRDFRLNIEVDNGTDEYLQHGQQLYDWLIRPLESEFAARNIETLVIVPDGALRTIPLAALHDGSSYLVERYALATSPGLTLLDPKPFSAQSYNALAGGLSESVQGFAALPSVERELGTLREKLSATVIQNQSFTLSRVKSELASGSYSVVHFATHGKFGSSYDESFLLTYDDKLLLNDLGRTIQTRGAGSDALELLVLSACETAAGDDRAALGLAGVALKAGARSALATLWEVDDKATLEVVSEFYAQLAQAGTSKSQGLRQAQLKLIGDRENKHPSKWAPFLLIGNWL
ncbi:CHAT domain-containing protein [Pseudohalioglobus lutimaris]|uniref:CHAT domain-containing protein n=1 Tax=Pseudohalioglobus lutimaris TaxID=1737061 RepID=UPI00096BC9FC|nr:CHAT domain-containing protein [Pseudohalioglobus lutimaris]